MAHDLECKNGVWSFAFTGSRDRVWHRLGQEMRLDATNEEWLEASGFNYSVEKVPAIADLKNLGIWNLETAETDWRFIVRTDNGRVLGIAKDSYQIVQPSEIDAWFQNYIEVDDRFSRDAMGVLRNGERLWATAKFNGDLKVAGEDHIARLLMSTSMDQTQATINQATTTRVVCANTMAVAHSDKRAMVKTSHRSKFDGRKVAKELAQIAKSFEEYKTMGDAMAVTAMAEKDVTDFFKRMLDIKLDAKKDDVSTRKVNQLESLFGAYMTTKTERNSNENTVWTALQAVTRYVDHDRGVRNADNEDVGRFDSAQWGSGNALKGKAMGLLMPLIKDRALIAA